MWRAFLFSGRFLTRLPLPDPGPADAIVAGRAALFYPLIGLLIGALLWGLAVVLSDAPASVAGVLILCLWVWLTGALHLDGLSDAADGWVGGLGSRERTLEIMRDPRSGAMGVVAVALLLLAKSSALTAMVAAGHASTLLWIPALARVQLLVAMLIVPYARATGMASAAVANLPRRSAWLIVIVSPVVVAALAGAAGLAVVIASAGLFAAWRLGLMKRLGGFTGDTAGALVELSEASALVVVVLLWA